jgi:hypothetical protein
MTNRENEAFATLRWAIFEMYAVLERIFGAAAWASLARGRGRGRDSSSRARSDPVSKSAKSQH